MKLITRKSNYIENNGLTNVVREKHKRANDGDKSLDRENRKRARRKVMENNEIKTAEETAQTNAGSTEPQVDYKAEYEKMKKGGKG